MQEPRVGVGVLVVKGDEVLVGKRLALGLGDATLVYHHQTLSLRLSPAATPVGNVVVV